MFFIPVSAIPTFIFLLFKWILSKLKCVGAGPTRIGVSLKNSFLIFL